MNTRPSVKDAFTSRLGRRGISQSFKEKAGSMTTSGGSTPTRPKDPPPPPPANKLMRSGSKVIYDIAENDEDNGLVILHTNNGSLRKSSAPSKPPRQRKARSQSFTPSSKNSDRISPDPPRAKSYEDSRLDENGITSLVTVVEANLASDTSLSSSTDEVTKEEEKNHIYEEIPAKQPQRPLPPIPKDSVVSTTSTVVSVSSKLSSLKAQIDEEDVKSIFVGATKYEILHYLEDAKERGVDAIQDEENEDNW